jgi:hypothetical protein
VALDSAVRQRSEDCARYVEAFNDPDLKRALRQRPLSTQQADEQKDLRKALKVCMSDELGSFSPELTDVGLASSSYQGTREKLFKAEEQLSVMKHLAENSRSA